MWKHLKINDRSYYIKIEFTLELLVIHLTDLSVIWKETVSTEEVISRFKLCNLSIKAPDESILDFIKSLFEEQNTEIILEEKDIVMKLEITKVIMPKMKIYFNLLKLNNDSVFRELTLPLLLLVNELKYRQDLLIRELEAKDVEILEYKLEGFKITRKNVITSKFEREEFNKSAQNEVSLRLKSGLTTVSETLVKDMNEFYPFYQKFVQPYSTEQLKLGEIIEENKSEVESKEAKEAKPSPKKRYTSEPNVPIKRAKISKKLLL